MLDFIKNPGLINKENLNKIHYVYRNPIRKSHVIENNGILYLREYLLNGETFLQLQIVPESLRDIIFIAFHANPTGAHFGLYQTFHKIRLRYFWPGMWKYISIMIDSCAGCRMANSQRRKCNEIIYSFPTDEPMKVVHADVYSIGSELDFSGNKNFMFLVCGLSTFACWEPLKGQDSKAYTETIMKILLQHGLSHTIIIDKDSKFRGVFEEWKEYL